jgi:hypothetical protein
VLGEYIGKIYVESKRRPRFLIETVARAETASGRVHATPAAQFAHPRRRPAPPAVRSESFEPRGIRSARVRS